MEPYLTITQINDFIFCPRSLYFGNIFRQSEATECFHATPQTRGTMAHSHVDDGSYSSRKDILSGITVYCEKYNLLGKIDIFEVSTGTLTERKYSVTNIYDGFRYQLYAQAFALEEMGYHVQRLRIHAMKDNRNYEIPLPSPEEILAFERTLNAMKNYTVEDNFTPNVNKCRHCIYHALCELHSLEEDAGYDDLS